jgi:MoxR-like ATPase
MSIEDNNTSHEEEKNRDLGGEPQKAIESGEPNSIQTGMPPIENPTPDIISDTLGEDARNFRETIAAIKNEIGKVIIGQTEIIDFMLAAIITDGHVLLEGVPGIAKTLTSKLLAKTLKAEFTRIQFTPDLMPTDIIGTTVFDMKRSEFHFKKGPVFSNLVLIDEINRAPAKTQAALIEVMEEHQVSIDGKTYAMQAPFFVIATQNPVEQEGTYKLPEAQLDRFMFKLIAKYPSLEEEEMMLKRFRDDFYDKGTSEVVPVLSTENLLKYRALVEKVHIKDELLAYIAKIINSTRNNSDLYLGASPRASLNILKASKALALMAGRSFVTPDDIKRTAQPVLNHRLILSYEREMEGIGIDEIIESLVRKVEVPR